METKRERVKYDEHQERDSVWAEDHDLGLPIVRRGANHEHEHIRKACSCPRHRCHGCILMGQEFTRVEGYVGGLRG